MVNYSPESFLAIGSTHRSFAWTATASNGAAIDRKMYRQAAFFVRAGVIGTNATIDYKIQESADGSTGWTDVTGAAITQIVADDGEGRIRVNLEGCKRYLRAVLTVGVATSQVSASYVLLDPLDSDVPNAVTWIKA